MHYVLGDIHNELNKLQNVLSQINISTDDELIVLGDLYDRGYDDADPVGVYFELCKLQGKCTWICGNHDKWLSKYIKDFYGRSERRQKLMQPYLYNSFELMRNRLTPVDMINIAEKISKLPLQIEREIDGKKYLFAHAMAIDPRVMATEREYLMGNEEYDNFLINGVGGYTSMCGHTPTGNLQFIEGQYLDTAKKSIWCNGKKNVFILDCGCGFGSGKLACLCIETGARFYSE